MLARREHRLLVSAGVIAVVAPWLAARHLAGRINGDLVPAMEDRLGTPVQIGVVEATLSGTVRLRKVRVGRLLAASAIEGSSSLRSLLAGRLRADEIRVVEPRLRVRLRSPSQRAGAPTDLHDLLRRAARGRGGPSRGHTIARPRRIVVTGGALHIDVIGHGTITASAVELHPQRGGVRLLSGKTAIDLSTAGMRIRGTFHRGAADLRLPSLRADRLLAVGGTALLGPRSMPPDGAAAGADLPPSAKLVEVSLGYRMRSDQALRFHARFDQPGRDPRIEIASSARSPRRLSIAAREAPLGPLAQLLPPALVLDSARATGDVIVVPSPTVTEVSGSLKVAGLVISDSSIARQPVSVDVELTGGASARADRVTVDRLELAAGQLRARIRADLIRRGGRIAGGTMALTIPPTPCADALASVPAPLRAHLAGLKVAGSMRARLQLSLDRRHPEETRLDSDISIDGCSVIADAPGADPRRLARPFEHTFGDGRRAIIGRGHGNYQPLGSLPAHLPGAFISAEDAHFYRHRGFDRTQIERSLGINLRAGRVVRGGSTITQQLVKNVFLFPHRTLARKLQEAVLTWRTEALASKRLILERYLNVIELGEHVFGVEAAAHHWFGKSARDLQVVESAFLAAITPAPRTLDRRIRRAGRLDAKTRSRVQLVLRAMRSRGVITAVALERATSELSSLRIRSSALSAR